MTKCVIAVQYDVHYKLRNIEETDFTHDLDRCMFWVQPHKFAYYECSSLNQRPEWIPPLNINYAGLEFESTEPVPIELHTWLFDWIKQPDYKLLYFVNSPEVDTHVLDLQKHLIEDVARKASGSLLKIQIRMKCLTDPQISRVKQLEAITDCPISKSVITI